MKKILLSIAILAITGAVIVGGTTAIFSDDEVSTGNTFTAGAIDLTIDNESYYNGVLNKGTTWLEPKNLEGELFFDFRDVKPGDYGEDTISLHVSNNDSYLCVDVTVTENADNGSTEPELNDEEPWTAGRGELADNIYFIWWADDGDNVLEENERVLSNDPIGGLVLGETLTVPLADSQVNIWNDQNEGGPLPGDSVRYIGKAWCFGDLTLDPVTPGDNDPTVNPGFICDGSQEDNSTQTDSIMGDVGFRAVQSRHNDGYVCVPESQPETAALTVDKVITFTNPNLPPVEISDFDLFIDDGNGPIQVFDEITVADLAPGSYTVTEIGPVGFVESFGLDCDVNGVVILQAGDNKTCRIINLDERETPSI